MSISCPIQRGLKHLDRSLFNAAVNLVALRVPSSSCKAAMKRLDGSLLNAPRLRSIVNDDGKGSTPDSRLVLLDSSFTHAELDSLPNPVQEFAKDVGAEVTTYSLQLGYDYWTVEQILSSVLPEGIEVPGSYEMIGHIAHLNLREEHLPYKSLVGEVVLDKNKCIRTVVNKIDSIDHTFRFFKMELLAGDDDMMAEMKESNCKFRFDFSSVYWNSRLQGEHGRIVKLFNKGDIICDVFAGVGPFAIPAAKNTGCLVFANDLNPVSFKYMAENIGLNKVKHLVRAYNMDGREFIKSSLNDLNSIAIMNEMVAARPPPRKLPPSTNIVETSGLPLVLNEFQFFTHYVMNLPGTALEFLDAFKGLFHGYSEAASLKALPIIHCHCFSRKDHDMEADVLSRAEHALGSKIGDNLIGIHRVRNVAPNKEMLCISFRLPQDVAFADPTLGAGIVKRGSESSDTEGLEKKIKIY